MKFKFINRFISPLITIVKTPIKQDTRPIILIKFIFSLKKIPEIKIQKELVVIYNSIISKKEKSTIPKWVRFFGIKSGGNIEVGYLDQTKHFGQTAPISQAEKIIEAVKEKIMQTNIH